MNVNERIEIINQWKLNRVFSELESGNMRIPRFQRAYVWERAKIVKLLNSIYNQYPIGSFFLWDTDTQMESFCRDITEFGFPNKPEANKFTFILDGQQRITSLYVTLKGKLLNGVDYKSICFNLDKRVFKIPTLKTEPNNIPVWKIYDDLEYGNLLKEYYGTGQTELGAAIQECHQILHEYPVSIIKSMNMDLDEVVTIFERINQGGKRLSLFDLVHASVWSKDFDLREKIKEFNEENAIRIFGSLDAETFTQSLALNIDGDCTNKHQLKLKNDDCKSIWEKTLECIRLTIDFIKQLGVQQLSIIPYPSLIAVIQNYFYLSKEKYISSDVKPLICDWFWTLTFSQRYSSSALTRMNEDALWIKSLVEGSREPRIFTVKLSVEDLKRVRMNTRSVIKNGILSLMALNNPQDFDNNDSVTLDKTNASRSNSKENHHFFPYSLATSFGVSQNEINSVLNFAFITKRLNGHILNNKPSDYLLKMEHENKSIRAAMQTHFIDGEAYDAATKDDFHRFIELRGKQIVDRIYEVCRVDESLDTVVSLEASELDLFDELEYEETIE